MKNTITILLILIYSSTFSEKINVDSKMIEMGWTFVSPFVLNKIKDPLTKEIITKTIPKIITQDAKAAAFEVTDAIYRTKNIKVLNKEFLSKLDKSINDGIKAINRKDYATAINGLATTVAFSERYIKSGILDQPTATAPTITSTINLAKADVVTSKEINGKLHLGEANDYLFFITNGDFTQKEVTSKGTNSEEDFSVTNDAGKKFNLGVARGSSAEFQYLNISRIQSDKNLSDKFKTVIGETFKKNLGEGQILKSEVGNYPNFKTIKYTYLYTDKESSNSSMAYVLIAFHDSTMFIINFSTSANEFLETSKSFDELMRTFFIIGVDEISDNDTKVYSKATINKISINKFPNTKQTGETWDNPFGNYFPDIYYIIADNNGQTLRSLNVAERKEDVNPQNLPVSFSLIGKVFTIDELKEPIFIYLYDYDSVTDPDKVGSVGFRLSDYMFGKDTYPAVITKSNQNIEISISVKWE